MFIMKKLKIMLLSFALLTVVGGALAFKAKFIQPYCTTTFDEHCNVTCPTLTLSTTSVVGNVYCYTIDEVGVFDDCKDANFNPITCEDLPTTLIAD
jgi:hypothetical protein